MVGEVIIKVKYKVCLEILKTQIFTTEKYGLLTSVYLGLQNDKNITWKPSNQLLLKTP